jgi:4-alpha-glucanotransferase
MRYARASGVLVHPTSFPGRFGIGDLGAGARRVLDFLAAGRQRLWQVLPLGPTGYGDSPYASFSAFAGNHLLIAPDVLVVEGWLRPADLDAMPASPGGRVDYGAVHTAKLALLRLAHERFRAAASGEQRAELDAFVAGNAAWLDDYALFMALKTAHFGGAWPGWEDGVARRDPAALGAARATLAGEIALHQFLQWQFFHQWADLRREAAARDIAIVGDLAIFVAHDSADVWAHRELFTLDERGMPEVVAGVPPDYFSPTGQRWGNPLYRWDVMAQTGYTWWIERVRMALRTADRLRLDHFRGFHAHWEIPGDALTAERGRWVPGPRRKLFDALRRALGEVPILAEDLGVITPPIDRLREHLGFPGMRVLQFAFGGDANSAHLPHTYAHDTVVYTGTHDNDTALGWFASCAPRERERALRYAASDGREINWDLLRLALASVADTAIVPLQDVLGLGSAARMNLPGRAAGNWAWRCVEEQLTPAVSARLAEVTSTYGR